MKKKTYIAPQMEVIDIKINTHLLAGSVDPNGLNDELQETIVEGGW